MNWASWDASARLLPHDPDGAKGTVRPVLQPCAVAFGSEGTGFDDVPYGALEGDSPHGCEWVYVPMAPGVRSLNLAATATLALATAARALGVGPFEPRPPLPFG